MDIKSTFRYIIEHILCHGWINDDINYDIYIKR